MTPGRDDRTIPAYLLRCWLFWIGVALIALAAVMTARAQHNHAAGHHEYQDWASPKTGNCCNDRDCGVLRPGEWREGSTGFEVAIDGQWCPVRSEHRLVRGRSPDWGAPHACVRIGAEGDCERLLCFVPQGGF